MWRYGWVVKCGTWLRRGVARGSKRRQGSLRVVDVARSEREIARWFAEVLRSGAHNPKPKEVVTVCMKYKRGYVVKPYKEE